MAEAVWTTTSKSRVVFDARIFHHQGLAGIGHARQPAAAPRAAQVVTAAGPGALLDACIHGRPRDAIHVAACMSLYTALRLAHWVGEGAVGEGAPGRGALYLRARHS